MNLYWFLLPFAIVNVLAELIQDYVDLVSTTTKYIENASKQKNKKEDPNKVLSRLEYIVKRIILKNKYKMDELAFMMTVPNIALHFHTLQECMNYQNNMQTEIYEAISLRKPSADTVDFGFTTSHLLLTSETRREIIHPFLLSLLQKIIGNIETGFNPTQLCTLIGLYKSSSRFTKLFIKTAEVDSDDNCILISNDDQITYFKQTRKLSETEGKDDIVEFLPGVVKTVSLVPDIKKIIVISLESDTFSETDEN
ncbi:uncharacterized protein LOC126841914 [Adelges cooleyi]|uniref:uncharacterized protein LOC126841914 n=1 Tax=Adelges cooleyi TaxID=133065 RepID=UPI0021807830|nr:uncharacterized protein LOC126841914 [Adelges cooleyi]XP_050434666.1 uncharacterized protein LOC126841914 [Adelges cooleyi]XP_050434667.1 uncharacterized protein LOC126841914 [Adelges cooleyi]